MPCSDEIRLRPHHLLCLQKYTGHGYSPAFTHTMNGLIARLRAWPHSSVSLVSGCDLLCEVCPHRAGTLCVSHRKTAALDASVLQAITGGQNWDTLAAQTAPLLTQPTFAAVCGSCNWYSLCAATERGILNEPI